MSNEMDVLLNKQAPPPLPIPTERLRKPSPPGRVLPKILKGALLFFHKDRPEEVGEIAKAFATQA